MGQFKALRRKTMDKKKTSLVHVAATKSLKYKIIQ